MTPEPHEPDAPDSAEFIPFDEFRNGLPHGRFRVIVNPALAVPFVAFHTRATPLALAIIGPGIAAALLGHAWTGGLLIAAGVGTGSSLYTPGVDAAQVTQRARALMARWANG